MRKVYEAEMRALEAGGLSLEEGLSITVADFTLTINLLNFKEFWGVSLKKRNSTSGDTGDGRIFALGFSGGAFVNIINFFNSDLHLSGIFNDGSDQAS